MLVLQNNGVGVICAKGPGVSCGLVEKFDDAVVQSFSAKFLRLSCKRSVDEKPIFTFKENDGVIRMMCSRNKPHHNFMVTFFEGQV